MEKKRKEKGEEKVKNTKNPKSLGDNEVKDLNFRGCCRGEKIKDLGFFQINFVLKRQIYK